MSRNKSKPGVLVDALDPGVGQLDRAAARRAATRLRRIGGGAELIVRTPDGYEERLPRDFANLTASMLEEVAEGHTIAVVSEAEEVSTSVAADFLGVSRPHVVKLIDSGLLPCRMVGTHRRVRMVDLAAYKRSVDRRHSFLDELMAEMEEMGLYESTPDKE